MSPPRRRMDGRRRGGAPSEPAPRPPAVRPDNRSLTRSPAPSSLPKYPGVRGSAPGPRPRAPPPGLRASPSRLVQRQRPGRPGPPGTGPCGTRVRAARPHAGLQPTGAGRRLPHRRAAEYPGVRGSARGLSPQTATVTTCAAPRPHVERPGWGCPGLRRRATGNAASGVPRAAATGHPARAPRVTERTRQPQAEATRMSRRVSPARSALPSGPPPGRAHAAPRAAPRHPERGEGSGHPVPVPP
jgi:hypothetical protein